jgi:hypothetical protein
MASFAALITSYGMPSTIRYWRVSEIPQRWGRRRPFPVVIAVHLLAFLLLCGAPPWQTQAM